jgi:hypothetical protein
MLSEVVELKDIHMLVYSPPGARSANLVYRISTALMPLLAIRDSLLLVASKPTGWRRELVENGRPRRSSDEV